MSKSRGSRARCHGDKRPTSSSRRSTPVLPGFYFDPVTNRYYKEDKNASAPPPPTSKTRKTSSDSTGSRGSKRKCICPCRQDPTKPVLIQRPGSLPALLHQREKGQIKSHVFQRRVLQVSAYGSKKQVVGSTCHRGTVSHLLVNASQDILLASAKSGHGAALWKYTVSKCDKFYVHIKRDENVLFSPVSEITDISFLPQVVRPTSAALISLLGGAGQHGRVSLLDLEQGAFVSTYYVPKSNVWSCCWNAQDHHSLCIGASKEGYVQDIVTNTRQVLFTNKSDVLCIRSAESVPLVYTGSRNRMLICHDLRAKTSAFQIEHQSSVGDIKLMKSEQTLISSAFNGQVVQWDLRMQRHVVAYPGHVNDYAPVKLKVDESESLLLIPGKDLQTRIWAVDTGALINTLPPPAEDSLISHHNIPACEVGLSWGGFYPGFAIAATGLLHWYSL